MRLDDINSFWPGGYVQFMKCHLWWSATSSSSFANVMKIYCEVNKNNEVKSRVTLNKTTLSQVKVFSQNSTSLHANYLK